MSCSFCGKAERHVRKLIAGPSVYICDECVDLYNAIIADEEMARGEAGEAILPLAGERSGLMVDGVFCSFCHLLTPVTECLFVPERGQLCPACLAAIRAVIDQPAGG